MTARTSSRHPSTPPEGADQDGPARDPQAGDAAEPEFLQALDALTVPELGQVLKRAQALRDAKLDSAKQDFLNRMKAEGEQLGLNLGSLFGGAAPAKRGRKLAGEPKGERPPVLAKYRSPTGDEWSGRGRMPKWLQAEEAEGRSRDEFLIDRQD
ncbi:H-NS histone family protein [Paeniroseomonas aquatica]|uniref:H-NS histone family protein n=1 Tax=Paeniroseomonas aquatica TaxID=373043 RepID=A0ABT8AG23_9PROT|nr:H-NS histone family protein [Paeniroseomonas aquatica]MDN3568638.1 H-NS histone family protein [Paeniroseomonas aquatica]